MESINSNEPSVIELKPTSDGKVFIEPYPLEVPSSKIKGPPVWLKKTFDYSISPVKRIGYSTSCAIYHVINFGFTIALFIFIGTSAFVSLSLFSVLIGLPLYYLVMECAILLARFELVMVFYMVENNPEIRNKGIPKLGYSCGILPSFFNFCQRLKILITDAQTYKIFAYQIFIKPFITFFTCWSVLIVGVALYQMITPILYLSDPNLFHNSRICYGATTCNENNQCTCHGWGINSFGNAMGAFFVGLVIFPFSLRISNLFAYYTKPPAYYFLTSFYSSRGDIADRQQLLQPQNALQPV